MTIKHRENVTLRIKRIYLDAIRAGDKKHEFRSANEHYSKMLFPVPKTLTLHYQNPNDKICVAVKKITRIKAPKELLAKGFFGDSTHLYKIHLGRKLWDTKK